MTPYLLLQMLLRCANAVGYTNYPDNVIREFIKEAARSGSDVFRVFDSLNWIPGMEVAMDEVLKQDKICQATICYTGDILDPKRDKYALDYYVKMAVAWAVSVFFVHSPEKTWQYLKDNRLDDFTFNKSLQKITESYRVTPQDKAKIRAMKRK